MFVSDKALEKIGDLLLDGAKIVFAGSIVESVFRGGESNNLIAGIVVIVISLLGVIFINISSRKNKE